MEQYLTFILAEEEYGVNILAVQEIRAWSHATAIPRTPSHVLGVINLRGGVVPVVDLRRRLGFEAARFGPATVVIVLRVAHRGTQRTVGIVVDAVSEVYDIQADDMTPAPELCGEVNVIYVKALATVEKKLLILLDIDSLIGETQMPSLCA